MRDLDYNTNNICLPSNLIFFVLFFFFGFFVFLLQTPWKFKVALIRVVINPENGYDFSNQK